MALAEKRKEGTIAPLLFGIPQLDTLMGYHQAADSREPSDSGDMYGSLRHSSSLTIVGEDGTGKSVLALHLASTYAALRYRARLTLAEGSFSNKLPTIVYASSDFSYNAANSVWQNFYLDYPWVRYVPFIDESERSFRADRMENKLGQPLHLELVNCSPSSIIGSVEESRMINSRSSNHRIHFIDIAANSTGDDWHYLASLLAALPRDTEDEGVQPPNLLIIDSVAGFETLIGQTNTFGQESSRRSRITQILKAASNSWHVVFVSEEPDGLKHHPEEYVTDTVIHLRRYGSNEKVRRVLEIEKSRARDVAQGQHPFEIRSGRGSSTRSWENPDDPTAILHPEFRARGVLCRFIPGFIGPVGKDQTRPEYNAYVQVFPSLHFLSKQFSGRQVPLSVDTDRSAPKEVTSFGIEYLDTLLSKSDAGGFGLPSSSITALIGEEGTRKNDLVEEFLIAAYSEITAIIKLFYGLARDFRSLGQRHGGSFTNYIRTCDSSKRKKEALLSCSTEKLRTILCNFGKYQEHDTKQLDEIATSRFGFEWEGRAPFRTRWSLDDIVKNSNQVRDSELEPNVALAFHAMQLLTGILTPVVFVATHDISREYVVDRIIQRHQKDLNAFIASLAPQDSAKQRIKEGIDRNLRRALQGWVTVRRIELIDTTSPQLWHVIEESVIQGISGLGLRAPDIRANVEPVADAGRVRVVISDLRILRETYPAVAEDPLFLPTLVFRLHRLGVTTIIAESESGRLEPGPVPAMSGSLRSLVDQQINTWKVNFFGEQRVAITVLPSAKTSTACLIRELRYESLRDEQPSRLMVDPLFEVFENIEINQPKAVRLQICLYDETPAFHSYVDSERGAFDEIFSSDAQEKTTVFRVEGHAAYSAFRDFCHLPTGRKLPFSQVFMVDGHWALGQQSALKPQWNYLFDPLPVPVPGSHPRFEDPFRLFVGPSSPASVTDSGNAEEPLSYSTMRRSDTKRMFVLDAGKSSTNVERFSSAGTTQKGAGCRADRFTQSDVPRKEIYQHRIDKNFKEIDRVPFMWDFGFLLCNWDQWQQAAHSRLQQRVDKPDPPFVKDILDRLTIPKQVRRPLEAVQMSPATGTERPTEAIQKSQETVPWRDFFEAAKLVAKKESARLQKPCHAFDIVSSSPESLTCTMMEIWLSEIFDDLGRFQKLEEALKPFNGTKKELVGELDKWINGATDLFGWLSSSKYQWNSQDKARLEEQLDFEGPFKPEDLEQRITAKRLIWILPSEVAQDRETAVIFERFLLVHTLGGYGLHLYQAWLLLIEVLDFSSFLSEDPVGFSIGLGKHGPAAATRHWYKTACASHKTDSSSTLEDSCVPVRLPGHFAARGDWFLAVANGSRSARLAEQAMDLLGSRRGNRVRLQLGLGLPVRDILSGKELLSIKSGLKAATPGQPVTVSYGGILEMGGEFYSADSKEASFFWLFRTGFQNYDRQSIIITNWLRKLFAWTSELRFAESGRWKGGFVAYDELVLGQLKSVKEFPSWDGFWRYIRVFRADLEASIQSNPGER